MASTFDKQRLYTRGDIAEIIGLPAGRRSGGDWMTGYAHHNGEFFIFCNIGVAGTTGDDYDNRWVGTELHWWGKWHSHLGQPRFSQLLSPGATVHIFHRKDTRAPFAYAGLGRASSVKGERPVKVVWSF